MEDKSFVTRHVWERKVTYRVFVTLRFYFLSCGRGQRENKSIVVSSYPKLSARSRGTHEESRGKISAKGTGNIHLHLVV